MKLLKPLAAFRKWFLESRRLDRTLLALCLASAALVCVIVGASLVEFNTKVYRKYLKPSFEGLRAESESLTTDWSTEGWCKARSAKKGVDEYDANAAFQGLTLYSTMGAYPNAELIDMDGKVVHRWELSFRKALLEKSSVADDRTHWRRVTLLPNGDLMAIYNVFGVTPYGGGLVKLDKDSKLLWRYAEHAHHDFDVDSAGVVYALIHENTKQPVQAAPHLQTPMLKDYIVKLSPDGKELMRVAVLDAFAKSEKYRNYLDTIEPEAKGDHTHTNDVEVISEAFAKHHDFCRAGDLLLSLREPSMLAIFSVEREEIVWASRGIWEAQHDPDCLDNGNLLIFDNQGNKGPGGCSRILEWNLETGAIEWCYKGTRKTPFETKVRGSQELLPNGNVLITESNHGRLFEITHEGKIVWEFQNPHRHADNKMLAGVMYSAQRYSRENLSFLGDSGTAGIAKKESAGEPDSVLK